LEYFKSDAIVFAFEPPFIQARPTRH